MPFRLTGLNIYLHYEWIVLMWFNCADLHWRVQGYGVWIFTTIYSFKYVQIDFFMFMAVFCVDFLKVEVKYTWKELCVGEWDQILAELQNGKTLVAGKTIFEFFFEFFSLKFALKFILMTGPHLTTPWVPPWSEPLRLSASSA